MKAWSIFCLPNRDTGGRQLIERFLARSSIRMYAMVESNSFEFLRGCLDDRRSLSFQMAIGVSHNVFRSTAQKITTDLHGLSHSDSSSVVPRFRPGFAQVRNSLSRRRTLPPQHVQDSASILIWRISRFALSGVSITGWRTRPAPMAGSPPRRDTTRQWKHSSTQACSITNQQQRC